MSFFVLIDPGVEQGDAATDWLPADGVTYGDAPRCPVCDRYVGMRPILPPIRLELKAWGHRWGDIAFGVGNERLISLRFRQELEDADLVGFTQFLPAQVVKATSRKRGIGLPPPYELASIAMGGAAIDQLASGFVRDGPVTCDHCGAGGALRSFARVVVKEGSWTGEDVFFAWGLPGVVLVSERFKSLCETKRISNCVLVPALEYEEDYYRRGQAS